MAILGIGCGINHMPNAELKALWLEYGKRVTEHHLRTGSSEPFVAEIAREQGWDI
jgi:hypothetical protein